MPEKERKYFKPSFKREVVDAILNDKLTYEQIEKKYGVERYLVQRWMKQIAPHGHEKKRASRSHPGPLAAPTYPREVKPTADTNRLDDRDKTIWELRMIIAKLTVKVERLTAELNNKRRYEDQMLYGDGDLAIDPDRSR